MERKLKVRGLSGAQLYGYNCPDKKDALKQAMLFSGALFLTFLFPTLNIILFFGKSHGDPNYYSPMEVPQSIFLPLQGMWNFVIYVRRAVARIQEDYPEMSYGHAFKNLLCHPDRVAPPITTGRRRRRSSQSSSNRRSSAATTTAAGQVQHDIENNSDDNLSMQKDSSFCAGVAASKDIRYKSNSMNIRRSSFCAPAGKLEEAIKNRSFDTEPCQRRSNFALASSAAMQLEDGIQSSQRLSSLELAAAAAVAALGDEIKSEIFDEG
eukprot:CAMPEP_0178908578 /NCGR_PEP_ID=MMETSP0786-20121207/8000_1 /TAXON_ID=186022 /ORGANISM="Thalassionema frauenfeldii, Strain CCMP 1798" /LENGTH=265 /DNA_ID=CAMNT_0020580495 /DNA_START=685 /DNA_END=1482 /DNA_ORIENTATION=+